MAPNAPTPSHEIIFNHPYVNGGTPLVVHTGADHIKWSYSLNTANFPTYGGEVVQILSVAIEDVTIHGVAGSYAQIEEIYGYFVEFIQIASAGRGKDPVAGQTAYNQQPMLMQYPHRGWAMKIVPRSLPRFRKGRDVIAPEWEIGAYVVDDSDDVQELKDLVLQGTSVQGDSFELTGAVGFQAANPWSDPFPENGGKVDFDPQKTAAAWKGYGDYYSNIIPSWTSGDFSAITSSFASSPAFLRFGLGANDVSVSKGNPTTTSQGGKDTSKGGNK